MRGLRIVALLAAAASLSVACGTPQDRDLCRQYADLQDTAAQVTDLDPMSTAEDLTSIANETLKQLDQLQAASDGLYDYAISVFRANLTALRETSDQLGDAALTTARPLIAEDATDAVTSYRQLQARLDVVCGTTT
jgi:hypothetical protein